MSEIGKEIIVGLNEALEYTKGQETGRAHRFGVLDDVDVATIRARQGLSQIQFCKRYRIPLTTLRNWEQGRRKPELAARLLLQVIDREPDAVLRALESPDAVTEAIKNR